MPLSDEFREQDRWLPIANVARLMKHTLPPGAKVSKDAKECMQECVSEFISFVTSEASDRCVLEKRKTVNGEDVLYSLHALGFENYAEVLKIHLAKYRQQQAQQRTSGRGGTVMASSDSGHDHANTATATATATTTTTNITNNNVNGNGNTTATATAHEDELLLSLNDNIGTLSEGEELASLALSRKILL